MPKLKDIALGIVVAPVLIPIMLIASYQDKKAFKKELKEGQYVVDSIESGVVGNSGQTKNFVKTAKYMLKKSLEPVLPNKSLYRSKKGFGVPIGKWFAEGRLTVREDGGGIHNASYIRKKVAEHRAGRSDHRMFLWNLWLFDIWRDAFGPQS